MSFWVDDISALLRDFGTSVTLPSAAVITAIFDADYVAVGDMAVESSGPVLTCRTADVSGLSLGQSVTIDAQAYTVRSIQPDGTGVTVLRLEK